MFYLPSPKEQPLKNIASRIFSSIFPKNFFWGMREKRYLSLILLDLYILSLVIVHGVKPMQRLISPLISPELQTLKQDKPGYEVFGFAPYWTFNKLDNVDFSTLTTFAYFGVEVDGGGNMDKDSQGYEVFMSDKATQTFKKAHASGTRVVLTLTQMKNPAIRSLMDSPDAQSKLITETVAEVKNRGIDGINIDFEYTGDPGPEYRQKFSAFVSNMTLWMHQEIPNSKVTVSVYASAVKDPKIYDIKALGESADGIFMMAYDFAVAGSNNAIPTSPLYGHKEGKYWYDVSTAVESFLSLMPSEKLILGVPWYGYNYAVEEPKVKTATSKGYYTYYKKGRRTYSQFVPYKSYAQTYALAQNNITPDTEDITQYQEGFDEYGKVSYKAYYVPSLGTWRMIFLEDTKSLGLKYDFAKDKSLGGVGMWALGFDDGKTEMWSLLKDKFGQKDLANNTVLAKEIR